MFNLVTTAFFVARGARCVRVAVLGAARGRRSARRSGSRRVGRRRCAGAELRARRGRHGGVRRAARAVLGAPPQRCGRRGHARRDARAVLLLRQQGPVQRRQRPAPDARVRDLHVAALRDDRRRPRRRAHGRRRRSADRGRLDDHGRHDVRRARVRAGRDRQARAGRRVAAVGAHPPRVRRARRARDARGRHQHQARHLDARRFGHREVARRRVLARGRAQRRCDPARRSCSRTT